MAKALLITTNKQNNEYWWNVVERGGELESLGKTLYSKNVTADDLDFDIIEGSIKKISPSGEYIPSGRRTDSLPGNANRIKEAIKVADALKIVDIYMYDQAIDSWTYYSIDNNSWDLVSSYIKNPDFDPAEVQQNRFKF